MEPVILTSDQQRVLRSFALHSYISKQFYLTGGTALAAYYLRHRVSDDLDFFTNDTVNLVTVTKFVQQMKKRLRAKKIEYEHLFDRHIFILATDPILKMEFTLYQFPRLAPLVENHGVMIDSLYDMAVNKLFTILDRNEPKDFVDLYYLLERFSLTKLIKGVKKKFDITISPLTLGSELLKVRHLTMMPRMMRPLHHNDLVTFFEKQAATLKKDILL